MCVYVCVHFTHCEVKSMSTYLQNGIILVLPHTVVCMELYSALTQTVMLESGRRCWHPFTSVASSTRYIVCLSWDTLTTHSKYSTLSSRFNIHWPWLEWVVRVVNLLSKFEGEVNCIWSTTSRWSCAWRRYSREV